MSLTDICWCDRCDVGADGYSSMKDLVDNIFPCVHLENLEPGDTEPDAIFNGESLFLFLCACGRYCLCFCSLFGVCWCAGWLAGWLAGDGAAD
jgi:hypothetical protein